MLLLIVAVCYCLLLCVVCGVLFIAGVCGCMAMLFVVCLVLFVCLLFVGNCWLLVFDVRRVLLFVVVVRCLLVLLLL